MIRDTPSIISTMLRWLWNIHTAAYFSTRGRNTGSDKSALSEGSCRRPSFTPLNNSLKHFWTSIKS